MRQYHHTFLYFLEIIFFSFLETFKMVLWNPFLLDTTSGPPLKKFLLPVCISYVDHTFLLLCMSHLGFPGGSLVKNRPAKQETWVLSLGQEDPLEKEMASHSSIVAWEIPWTDRPDMLYSMGLQRVGHDLATKTANNNMPHLLLLKTGHFR